MYLLLWNNTHICKLQILISNLRKHFEDFIFFYCIRWIIVSHRTFHICHIVWQVSPIIAIRKHTSKFVRLVIGIEIAEGADINVS